MAYAILTTLFVVAALVDGATWNDAMPGVLVLRLWPWGPGLGLIDRWRVACNPGPDPGYVDVLLGRYLLRFCPAARVRVYVVGFGYGRA